MFEGTIMTHVLGICALNRFESCVGHSHCVRIFMQDFGVRPSSYTTSQPAATHALVWYCWWFKNPKKQADRSFIPLFTGFYASFRWLTTPDFWTINSIDWWHRAPTLHAIPSKEMMNQTGRTQNKISMTSGIKTFKVNMILGTKKSRLDKSIFFEFDPVVPPPPPKKKTVSTLGPGKTVHKTTGTQHDKVPPTKKKHPAQFAECKSSVSPLWHTSN